MAEGGENKTEAPTPKRLADARKEGQFVKSPDISTWLGLAAIFAVLPFTLGPVQDNFIKEFHAVREVIANPEPAKALAVLGGSLMTAVMLAAPACLVAMVVAIVANLAQSGGHLATKAAKPQWKRLDPIKGFKRIFSPQTLWETVKLLVKSIVVGVVLWRTMKTLAPQLISTGIIPLSNVLATTLDGINGLIRSAIAAGIVIAVIDYMVARRRIMKQLRMTLKEVQDEHKQQEGDPLMKGMRKSRALAMSRNRMMSEIATADVVLVNPTHVAVALRYEPEKGAPRVVAKGSGNLATRIRGEAGKHRVPMVENIPLARAVYSAVDVGHEIPLELYTAIAQVLAFVMRLKSRGASSGMHKLQVPDIPAETTPREKRRRRRQSRRRSTLVTNENVTSQNVTRMNARPEEGEP